MGNFKDILQKDIDNVFLNSKEFAQTVTFTNNGTSTEINVQFFEDSLDSMNSNYQHIWCSRLDVPLISTTSTFTILGKVYGVVEFTVDELNLAVDVLLAERL